MDFAYLTLFNGLGESGLKKVSALFTPKTYTLGEHISQEGERINFAFVLAKGHIAIYKKDFRGEPTLLHEIYDKDNTLFNLTSLVDEGPATTTVKCLSDCTVYVLKADTLHAFMSENPDVGYQIAWNLAKELALFLRKQDENIKNFYKEIEELL
jgi:CRP-like cAMP-binding protein